MNFNDLLVACDRAGQKTLADGLCNYILINFRDKDFHRAAEMMTEMIVNWEPRPVMPEEWVTNTDFAFAHNFAALMRSRGVLPPPAPIIELTEEVGEYELVFDDEGNLVTTEYINDR
jgi:hypothetical protein